MDEVQSVEEGFFWLSKALLTNPELLQYIEDTLILRSQNDDDGNYDSYRGWWLAAYQNRTQRSQNVREEEGDSWFREDTAFSAQCTQQCSVLNAHWTLDNTMHTGHWVLDTVKFILHAGHWTVTLPSCLYPAYYTSLCVKLSLHNNAYYAHSTLCLRASHTLYTLSTFILCTLMPTVYKMGLLTKVWILKLEEKMQKVGKMHRGDNWSVASG